jgi:hypothetical protein
MCESGAIVNGALPASKKEINILPLSTPPNKFRFQRDERNRFAVV